MERKLNLSQILCAYYLHPDRAQLKRLLYGKTFPISTSFINVAIIEEKEQKAKDNYLKQQDSLDSSQVATFRDGRINSFEDIHKPKKPILVSEIFDQKEDEKPLQHILIEGRAGIGKTTLCQYIANQWAEEEGKLKAWREKFEVVIWLPLRELLVNSRIDFEKDDLATIIHRHFLTRVERKQFTVEDVNIELTRLKKSEKLLLLLDGYDEIVPALTENRAFKEFFEEELLANTHWILTSRPFYAINIKVDRRLENIGFVDEDIPSYVNQFFSDVTEEAQTEQEDKTQALIQWLQQNSNLHGIAHIPVNLELICSIWEHDSHELSQSLNMTLLYEKIVLNLFKRYLHKFYGRPLTKLTWQGLAYEKKLDCQSLMKFLETVAWEGMQSPGVILSASKINDVACALWLDGEVCEQQAKAALSDLGLLKGLGIAKTSVLDQDYYFIHLTFQEYFAARYVVSHFAENEIQNFIKQHKFNKGYEVVWWFVAGLLGKSDEHNKDDNLQKYFDLLASEPISFFLIHQRCLEIRCWDEAGLPDFPQKEQWKKDVLFFTSTTNENQESFSLIKNCLLQSPLLLQQFEPDITQQYDSNLKVLDNVMDQHLFVTKKLLALKIKTDVVIQNILRLLQNKNQQICWETIFLLKEFNVTSEATISRLVELLQDQEYILRIAAAIVLMKLEVKTKDAISTLVALLKNNKYRVCSRTIQNIVSWKIRTNATDTALVALLQHKHPLIRLAAARGLITLQLELEATCKVLIILLKEEDPAIRVMVVQELVRLQVKSEAAITAFIALLQDEYSPIRLIAAEKLISLQSENAIEELMVKQVEHAMQEADHILFLVDARAGLLHADQVIAKKLRQFSKSITLVMNRSEIINSVNVTAKFYSLGLGEPTAISASHKHGVDALIERILQQLPAVETDFVANLEGIKIVIVGRPNVGKSTLFNVLTRSHEALVADWSRLTRNRKYGQGILSGRSSYLIIDTGGLGAAENAIQVLIELIKEEDNLIRLAVAETLIKLQVKTEVAIEVLVFLLKVTDIYITSTAINILARLGVKTETVIAALVELLYYEVKEICLLAAVGLLTLQVEKKAAIQVLISLLRSEDWHGESKNKLQKLPLSEVEWMEHLSNFLETSPQAFQNFKTFEPFPLVVLLRIWTEKQIDILTIIAHEIIKRLPLIYYQAGKLYLAETEQRQSLFLTLEQFQQLYLTVAVEAQKDHIPLSDLYLAGNTADRTKPLALSYSSINPTHVNQPLGGFMEIVLFNQQHSETVQAFLAACENQSMEEAKNLLATVELGELFQAIELAQAKLSNNSGELVQYLNAVHKLYQACREGDITRLKTLDLSQFSSALLFKTLMIAIQYKQLSVLSEFIDNRSIRLSTIKDAQENNLLHQVAALGNAKAFHLLTVNHDLNPKALNTQGQQPLHKAIENGHLIIVEQLIEKAGSTDPLKRQSYQTQNKKAFFVINGYEMELDPLQLAVVKGHVDIVKYLLPLSSEEDLRKTTAKTGQNRYHGNVLHLAVISGHPVMLKTILFAEKVSALKLIESKNADGLTPLSLACYVGAIEAITLLIRAKAILDTKDDMQHNNPLHWAVLGMQPEVVEVLLRQVGNPQLILEIINRPNQAHKRPFNLARQSIKQLENKTNVEGKSFKLKQLDRICHLLETMTDAAAIQRYQVSDFTVVPIRNLVFQGGGAKGLGYIGVLKGLEQQYTKDREGANTFWDNLQRVAGTSAGAITAMLLAIGYRAEKVEQLFSAVNVLDKLKDFDPAKMDVMKANLGKILEQAKASGLLESAQALKEEPGVMKGVKTLYKAWRFKGKHQDLFTPYIELIQTLVHTQGMCSSDALRDWFEELLFERTSIHHITFGELARLIGTNNQYKHLYVVTTQLTPKLKIRVFSSERKEDENVVIADAIRASMSIPLVFQPCHIRVKNNGVLSYESACYVDGGMIKNLPIELFDKVRYQQLSFEESEGDYPVHNKQTLGMSLVATSTSATQAEGIDGMKSLVLDLMNVFWSAETLTNEFRDEPERVIKIDVQEVTTLDFGVATEEPDKLKRLIAAGEQAVNTFFGKESEVFETAAISSGAKPAVPKKPIFGDVTHQYQHMFLASSLTQSSSQNNTNHHNNNHADSHKSSAATTAYYQTMLSASKKKLGQKRNNNNIEKSAFEDKLEKSTEEKEEKTADKVEAKKQPGGPKPSK